jgi:hypothetical protein
MRLGSSRSDSEIRAADCSTPLLALDAELRGIATVKAMVARLR